MSMYSERLQELILKNQSLIYQLAENPDLNRSNLLDWLGRAEEGDADTLIKEIQAIGSTENISQAIASVLKSYLLKLLQHFSSSQLQEICIFFEIPWQHVFAPSASAMSLANDMLSYAESGGKLRLILDSLTRNRIRVENLSKNPLKDIFAVVPTFVTIDEYLDGDLNIYDDCPLSTLRVHFNPMWSPMELRAFIARQLWIRGIKPYEQGPIEAWGRISR